MVIVPCSMSTLGAIAGGMTTNLITRAADVHLKEAGSSCWCRAKLRLRLIHLENMLKVTRAGAVVLPAMPGWYHRPRQLRRPDRFRRRPHLRSARDSEHAGPALGSPTSSDSLQETERDIAIDLEDAGSTSKKPSEIRCSGTEPMAKHPGAGRTRARWS